jgi:protein-S-isoprenylcysteine O-methyltransferase Ste14
MARVLAFGFALVAYASFLGSFLVMMDFLTNAGVVCAIDRAPQSPLAIPIDLGLIAIFGVSHSVMARPAFKSRWTRIVPAVLERSVYVLTSSMTLTLIALCWRSIPSPIFSIESTPLRMVLWAISFLGIGLTVWSTFLTDHFDLFGLRQAWLHMREREYTPVPFQERSLYKLMRHPMMLGLLVWMWVTPTMSVGHLVFAASMSAYVAIGIVLEERGLSRTLGEPYADYRRRVRALLPIPTTR